MVLGPTLTQVRNWDVTHLTGAASRWRSTAASWEGAFTQLTDRLGGQHWDGAAGTRARERAGTDLLKALGRADRLRNAADVAHLGADRIIAARNSILDAVTGTERLGFTVAEDFSVRPRVGEDSPRARELSAVLSARLDRLMTIDKEVAARIASAATPLGGRSAFHVKQAPPGQPDRGDVLTPPDDPKEFSRWWQDLTQDEKDRIAGHDDAIGNRGGMPFVERDVYNRRHLGRLRAESQADVDELQDRFDDLAARVYMGDHGGETTGELQALAPRLADARRRLDGYQAVQDTLDAGGRVPRLLGFIDDRGHAAVSIGDPDTATRTAVFVPGTGQDMPTLDAGSRRGWDMFQAALDADPSLSVRDVSVTTWLGYDRPMTLTEAAWPDRARRGAESLDAYLDGMHASHRGAPALDTVIGHSYGSTLVGGAATNGHHLAADNVIAVGSPGMLSGHAGDLSLDSGARVYSMTAGNDPISLVTGLTLGADPNTADYGATRLVTDPGPALPYSAGLLPGVAAHSSYWDEGNPGLGSMGAIIAGLVPQGVLR